jgi:hypothetical protein
MYIVHNVFEAADEEESFLLIGKKCLLEYLYQEQDGIFSSINSWRSFINGNFTSDYSSGCYREDVKKTTLRKWCYPAKEYINKFVHKIGKDKFIQVAEEDIDLSFDYELYYCKESTFPTAVEIFVTAKIKE